MELRAHAYLRFLTHGSVLCEIKMSDCDKEVLTVFSVREKPRAVTEVASLLHEEAVSTLSPVRLKVGKAYIYRPNRGFVRDATNCIPPEVSHLGGGGGVLFAGILFWILESGIYKSSIDTEITRTVSIIKVRTCIV